MSEMSKQGALVLALKRAITEPSECKSLEYVEFAEQIAVGLSEFEIAAAKREAEAQARGLAEA